MGISYLYFFFCELPDGIFTLVFLLAVSLYLLIKGSLFLKETSPVSGPVW